MAFHIYPVICRKTHVDTNYCRVQSSFYQLYVLSLCVCHLLAFLPVFFHKLYIRYFFSKIPPANYTVNFTTSFQTQHSGTSAVVLNRYTPLSQSRKITRDPDSHWKQKGDCMLVHAATFICGRYAEKASGLFCLFCFVSLHYFAAANTNSTTQYKHSSRVCSAIVSHWLSNDQIMC